MQLAELLHKPFEPVKAVLDEIRTASAESQVHQLCDTIAATLVKKHYHEMSEALVTLVDTWQFMLPWELKTRLVYAAAGPILPRMRPFPIAQVVDSVCMVMPSVDDAKLFADYFIAAFAAVDIPGPETGRAYDEANLLLKVTIGSLLLKEKKMVQAQQVLLGEVANKLERKSGYNVVLCSRAFRAAAEYYKLCTIEGRPSLVSPRPAELHQSLDLFLAYQRLEALCPSEIEVVARDYAVSAVLSPKVLDFSEVLRAPILHGLCHKDVWLRDLLAAANKADIAEFDRVLKENEEDARNRLFGDAAIADVRNKLKICSLLRFCYRNRNFTCAQLKEACAATSDHEAQNVFIRAIALGGLRGKIDLSKDSISVTWVHPMSCDGDRVSTILTAMEQWRGRVAALHENLSREWAERTAAT